MKKLLTILLAVTMVFSLTACMGNVTPSGNEGDTPDTSQNDNQGEENKDDIRYVMTFKEKTNSNPTADTNWTVNYMVFEFGEKYLKSAYDVYKFDSVEDAEKFMTHERETMGMLNEMKLDGTTVYKYDDYYDGTSLSAVKGMFDESDYTLTEK